MAWPGVACEHRSWLPKYVREGRGSCLDDVCSRLGRQGRGGSVRVYLHAGKGRSMISIEPHTALCRALLILIYYARNDESAPSDPQHRDCLPSGT